MPNALGLDCFTRRFEKGMQAITHKIGHLELGVLCKTSDAIVRASNVRKTERGIVVAAVVGGEVDSVRLFQWQSLVGESTTESLALLLLPFMKWRSSKQVNARSGDAAFEARELDRHTADERNKVGAEHVCFAIN